MTCRRAHVDCVPQVWVPALPSVIDCRTAMPKIDADRDRRTHIRKQVRSLAMAPVARTTLLFRPSKTGHPRPCSFGHPSSLGHPRQSRDRDPKEVPVARLLGSTKRVVALLLQVRAVPGDTGRARRRQLRYSRMSTTQLTKPNRGILMRNHDARHGHSRATEDT